MLAKCTNLECSKAFRFLHQGKVFRLSPTPDLRKVSATASRSKPEIMTRRTRVRPHLLGVMTDESKRQWRFL
jgi:hypothetical protein